MYNLETFLQVQMTDGRRVIGRVHSTEPILVVQPLNSFDVFYETQFEVIREVPYEEVKSLLGITEPLAN